MIKNLVVVSMLASQVHSCLQSADNADALLMLTPYAVQLHCCSKSMAVIVKGIAEPMYGSQALHLQPGKLPLDMHWHSYST